MAEPFNTPIPGATPRSTSPVLQLTAVNGPEKTKSTVLHIGDDVHYNLDTYAEFSREFTVIRPSTPERQRPEFIRALRNGKWGQFAAIFRPFWGSGGEMGNWDDELISLLPASCRVFASAGAGFDWADTKALGEKGVIYCNSGLAAAEAVSDFAVAMVISTFRHLPWCMGAATTLAQTPSPSMSGVSESQQQLFHACHSLAAMQSHNLRNHVLGLIGMGNIGQKIAAKFGCPAFGMQIHYYDVVRKPESLEQELQATFHNSLESLLRVADCIVLCTPASVDGRPLITREAIAHMKQYPVPARFVNVARGSLVDEDALADALEEGRISAAALDVHAAEPDVHPRLLKLATTLTRPSGRERRVPAPVMLTCHNAGGTLETHSGFEELSMRNIMAVLGGREAITPVNLQHLENRV